MKSNISLEDATRSVKQCPFVFQFIDATEFVVPTTLPHIENGHHVMSFTTSNSTTHSYFFL